MKIEAFEQFWTDKSVYDNAERLYFEAKRKPVLKKNRHRNRKMAESNEPKTAEQQKPQNKGFLYLNPLTVEAHFFLESLNQVCQKSDALHLDPDLATLLENIVIGIEKYLDKKPIHVMPTGTIQIVPQQEICKIKRTYNCSQCNNRILGISVDRAVEHIIQTHGSVEPIKNAKHERLKSKHEFQLSKKAITMINTEMTQPSILKENYEIAEKLKILPEYKTVENDLTEIMKPAFSGQQLRLYKFGSRMTGIGTRNSDLDIFVDTGNTFQKYEHRASSATIAKLRTVCKLLVKSNKWRISNVIENARVPIIKVIHCASAIECDIGFSNSLGYCNTNLLKYLFEIQPLAQFMCIFVKKWLWYTRLSDHFTTYSITLMVIYFLQIKRLLPSIEYLQDNLKVTQCVGPWIVNYKQNLPKDLSSIAVNPQVTRQYICAFFDYYASFNFAQSMVCPYFGLDRLEIQMVLTSLPERYAKYVNADAENALQTKKPMIVQDPIQLNHNVTKAITKNGVTQFVEYCRQTVHVISCIKS